MVAVLVGLALVLLVVLRVLVVLGVLVAQATRVMQVVIAEDVILQARLCTDWYDVCLYKCDNGFLIDMQMTCGDPNN